MELNEVTEDGERVETYRWYDSRRLIYFFVKNISVHFDNNERVYKVTVPINDTSACFLFKEGASAGFIDNIVDEYVYVSQTESLNRTSEPIADFDARVARLKKIMSDNPTYELSPFLLHVIQKLKE